MKITFDHVSASYGKKPILQDISFCARSGAITALVGRNGAGKTTLIRCLTGEKTHSGRILLHAQDLAGLTVRQRAEQIACLPQTLPQPHVTVEELVLFGRTPHIPFSGHLSEKDKLAATHAMEQVGIFHLAHAFVDTLSGGERRKAFFAMVLAQDTPVIVLDEPTAHLDLISRFEFGALLQSVCRSTGKTFLLIMHDLTDVLRYADRIAVLHENNIVFDGTSDEFLTQDIASDIFHVRIRGNREEGFSLSPSP